MTGCDDRWINVKEMKSMKGRSRNIPLTGYIKFLVLIGLFGAIVIFRTYLIDRVIVSGTSMNHTFTDGSVLWVRKFNLCDMERYDIVVAETNGRVVVKRVVGLPYETLEIVDGFVYINGDRLSDDYGGRINDSGAFGGSIELGEDEFFLLGDNRNHSIDSRSWGSVQRSDLKGICEYQIFPLNRIGTVRPVRE